MQSTGLPNTHQYNQQHSTHHQEYIQDLPIEEFKKIDEKRIKNEFYVLPYPDRYSTTPTRSKKRKSSSTASTRRARTGTAISECVRDT